MEPVAGEAAETAPEKVPEPEAPKTEAPQPVAAPAAIPVKCVKCGVEWDYAKTGKVCPGCGQARKGRAPQPPISAEEKARRNLEKATRLAQNAGVPAEIAAKYGAQAVATPAAPPKPPPTKEQIAKAEKAIAKSAQFIGDVILEIVTAEPTLSFKEERARDLGEAWGEILAEYLGENAADVVKWVVAIGGTGYVVSTTVKEVRAHNEKHKKDAGNLPVK